MESNDRYRWLLECDDDGEVRTFPDTNESLIVEALATTYAALYDTTDESCVSCFGEPDRRIIEIRTFPDGKQPRYGVVSIPSKDKTIVTLETDPGFGRNVLSVCLNEILTRRQAEQVFCEFFQSKAVPAEFEIIEKWYLFGPDAP